MTKMRLFLSTCLACQLAVAAGCMSNEQAADLAFQDLLSEMGLDQRGDQMIGKADSSELGMLEEATLCQVLRRALGDDPRAQNLMFTSGWLGSVGAWHLEGGGGLETVYDVANYQVGRFAHAMGSAFKTNFGIHARASWYRGFLWGYHTSVLDAAGPRGGVKLSWAPPLVRMIGEVFVNGTIVGPRLLKGAQLGISLGPKVDVNDVAVVTGFLPTVRVDGGYAWPYNSGPLSAASIAERDQDLGARLNTSCGEDLAFVQYEGSEVDADAGYHTQRAKALAAAIRRSTALLGLEIDPAGYLLAKATIGLGVARDHGGISAVCGGTAQPGELSPLPVPQPRCPNRPDVNPHDPEGTGEELPNQPQFAPEASFLAPHADAEVVAPFKVELAIANAEEVEIQSVSLKLDGQHVHEWMSAPYTVELQQVDAGEHTVMAVLKSPDGQIHETETIAFTVRAPIDNTPTETAPTETAPTETTQTDTTGTAPTNTPSTGTTSTGTTSTGGTSTGGTTGTTPTGTAPGYADDGGCSVGGAGAPSSAAVLLALLALALVGRSRRTRP